jgi:Transglutaminase-like superfamily
MPPEEFERARKGDCEDFALYAWRQVQSFGYPTRFVGGKNGRYGEGHAWVTFEQDGKTFLLEPQASAAGPRLPRLSTLAYKPDVSVEWDGEKVHFYFHKERKFTLPAVQLPSLVLEWAFFYARLVIMAAYLIPVRLAKLGFRKFRKQTNRR